MLPAILTPVNAFVPALLARVSSDRLGASLARQAVETARAEQRLAEAEARRAVYDERLLGLEPVRRFLADAATTLRDTVDPMLRTQSMVLEAAVQETVWTRGGPGL